MCIAIVAPGTARLLTFEEFENCHTNNSDGMGLVWSDEGKLRIIRRMTGLGKFYKAYRTIHERGKDMLVHFRFATHGAEDESNVHPVSVGPDMAFIHNGIISGFGEGKKGRSDTRHFGDAILKQLPDNWLEEPAYWSTVEHLTLGSKLAFMVADGSIKIMHEKQGLWDEGNWLSNTSYKTKNYWRQSYNQWAYSEGWDGEGVEYGPTANKRGAAPSSSWPPEKDSGRFSGGYFYTEKEQIVCEACVNKTYASEPLRQFVPLWDDGVGLNCDVCSLEIVAPYEKRIPVMKDTVMRETVTVPTTAEEREALLEEALAVARAASDSMASEGGTVCVSAESVASPLGG